MKAKAIAGVLALGVVALFGAPAAAGAQIERFREPGGESVTTEARGTHRYNVQIAAFDGHVTLTATKVTGRGDERQTEIAYERPLTAKPIGDHLHFSLGRAGKIDLRFVEESREGVKPPPECKGAPEISELGHYVGTISFHPPGGFTRVAAHRTLGLVIHQPLRHCSVPAPSPHDEEEAARYEQSFLMAGTPDGRRRFEATSFPPLDREERAFFTFVASATRKEGALTITASTSSARARSALLSIPRLDELPGTATVEPTAPFTGSATFELPSRKTATVSGDLAVELLEFGKVQLTGPNFDAGACSEKTCTKSLPKALYPSQLFYR